jgi:hypothetical protein
LARAEVGDPSSPLLFNSLSAGAKSRHHLKEGRPIPTLPEVTIGMEGAPPPVRGLSGYYAIVLTLGRGMAPRCAVT